MADNQQTKVQPIKAPANPTQIEWPQDQYGITSELKKVGVRAIARVNGHPDKALVMDRVLKTLLAHLKARYPDQQAFNAALDEFRDDQTAKRVGQPQSSPKVKQAAVALSDV